MLQSELWVGLQMNMKMHAMSLVCVCRWQTLFHSLVAWAVCRRLSQSRFAVLACGGIVASVAT